MLHGADMVRHSLITSWVKARFKAVPTGLEYSAAFAEENEDGFVVSLYLYEGSRVWSCALVENLFEVAPLCEKSREIFDSLKATESLRSLGSVYSAVGAFPSDQDWTRNDVAAYLLKEKP